VSTLLGEDQVEAELLLLGGIHAAAQGVGSRPEVASKVRVATLDAFLAVSGVRDIG
jgi:hypothetical protein